MRVTSVFSAALAAVAVSSSVIPRSSGSLSLADDKPLLTFNYATSDADSQNWIGLWDAYYGGPENETSVSYSTTWDWAPDASGSIQLSTSKLQPGRYKAFFLAKGGYKWLADPIEVIYPGSGPLEFLIDDFTTKNARVGDAFSAVISGLLGNPPDFKTKFTKVSGDDWVQVSSAGTLTGTPKTAGTSKLVVEATSTKGSKARLNVSIPIRSSSTDLVASLNVLSFNIWQGGHNVNDYHRKQVSFLAGANADIVGMQESFFNDSFRLGDALGWYNWQSSDVSILSRYPIVEVVGTAAAGGGVRIALDGDKSQVIMWNVHLGYTPYGPYDFCFSNMTNDQVMQRETDSGRTPQIIEVVGKMKTAIANYNDIPVLLTGDFNAPSHLDWTKATASQHCGVGEFAWPSSIHPTEAGLVDSFREIHEDPSADPGITWSPIYLENDGRPEPMDRVDFVYHKGLVTVDSNTVVVGHPMPEPNQKDNEWPTDHAAMKTTFKVPSSR